MREVFTERQRREINYHRERASRYQNYREAPVTTDVVTCAKRRSWNAYWSTYDVLLDYDWSNKKVLVPGCGFGDDVVRVAALGAEVYGFDISPETIDIAKDRCANFGYENVHFDVMASERLKYESDFFDLVFCLDIMHHVDIARTSLQFQHVLKRNGKIIGNELYTHRHIENLFRKNLLVENFVYPKMLKYIYGTSQPYITEDEHKIDDREFAILEGAFDISRRDYFNIFIGRIVPDRYLMASKIDRLTARMSGLGHYLAGRVVFDGCVQN